MNIINITDENNCNCTESDVTELTISPLLTLITIVPCGMSLVCLISFMAYTLTKTFFQKIK